MKFASLGSGSSGNATLIHVAESYILIDCGFGLRETERRLARLGVEPEELGAILVTHEHSDHIKGAAPFSRKYATPLYMTQGTWLARDYGQVPELRIIKNYQRFSLGEVSVLPVAVPHDAREPAQFVLQHDALRLGVLTDLGSITAHVLEVYQQCDGLLVEANHDLQMLWNGPYPPSLKSRVASDWGHLNNQQTADLLDLLYSPRLQQLVIGHISRKNNSVEAVKNTLGSSSQLGACENVLYACQDDGFEWVELSPH